MKIHPATRIFQALRIVVNNELDEIQKGLEICFGCLKPEGRLAVISYHSLEDRAVKEKFRAWKQAGKAVWICKKPITPGFREIRENPSARSAKLRLVERII
jgi:16S rRNA (cytosine1402-N4)-methyltransferase